MGRVDDLTNLSRIVTGLGLVLGLLLSFNTVRVQLGLALAGDPAHAPGGVDDRQRSELVPKRLGFDELVRIAEQRSRYIDGAARAALLEELLRRDPYRASAWFDLAEIYTREDGQFSTRAQDAFERSMLYCALCDRILLERRLVFVLDHWPEVPDSLRRKVFEGADLLSWRHHAYAFLDAQRRRAEADRIPFRRYLSEVDSPRSTVEVAL